MVSAVNMLALGTILFGILGTTLAFTNSTQNDVQDLHLTPNQSLWEAFSNSFAMIIATELGDKTFFIAALLAMRHDRLAVFIGAAGALGAMTILSAVLGLILPALLPKQYTHWASVLLFVFFGIRNACEAYGMFRTGEGVGPSGELEEVEQSLKEGRGSSSVALQALTLTFLAEWGDRSQIATIALSAAKDPYGVTMGGVVGHGCCTSLAVLGGRALADQISERVVMAVGAALFLGFAAHGVFASV